MFNALIPATESLGGRLGASGQFEMALEALTDFTFLDANFYATKERFETYDRLKALKSAIEKFGDTRSLTAFANFDGSLLRVFPNLPGIEALTEAPMMLSDAALEQLSVAAEGLIGEAWSAAKHFFQRFRIFFKRYGIVCTILRIASAATITALTGGLAWPILANSVAKVALSWTAFTWWMHQFKSLTAGISAAIVYKLPDSEEGFSRYKSEIEQIFKDRSGVTIKDSEGSEGQTLEQKGYSQEKIIQICKAAKSDMTRLLEDEHVYTSRLEALSQSPAAQTEWGKQGFVFLSQQIALTLEEVKKIVTKQVSTISAIHTAAEAAKKAE